MANPIVEFLNKKKYTALEICQSTGINATSLTNLINKTTIELCSKKVSRGVVRQYCLFDVYAIALLNCALKTVKDYTTAVNIVNDLNFEVARQAMLAGELHWKNDKEMKADFCRDIFNATPELYQRDMENPWIIIKNLNDNNVHSFKLNNISAPIGVMYSGGFVLNITYFLSNIDKELAIIKGGDMKKFQASIIEREINLAVEDAFLSSLSSGEEDV